VGYVQGQAFLAGMFLLNSDLFDSFICFANLLNRPYFQTFYRFNNIDKYLNLFSQLLNHHLPKLSAHFVQMSIEPNCFALDWFFTIYSKSLPLDVVSRIWDMFFRDGDVFIFRTAIAILSMYEERLCQLDTFHCLQFLTRLPDDLNVTSLFKAIDKINFDHTDCELFYLIA
jgi:TBC1 domain family member 14